MEEWINYLTKFTRGICDSNINQNENESFIFITSEIFDLKISLSTKYGFLEILFPDNETQNNFLYFSNINKNIIKKDNVKVVKTNWEETKFPCRVFVENNKIQFYDKRNDLVFNEKLDKRIKVLQSIFKILLDMKKSKALKNVLEN